MFDSETFIKRNIFEKVGINDENDELSQALVGMINVIGGKITPESVSNIETLNDGEKRCNFYNGYIIFKENHVFYVGNMYSNLISLEISKKLLRWIQQTLIFNFLKQKTEFIEESFMAVLLIYIQSNQNVMILKV